MMARAQPKKKPPTPTHVSATPSSRAKRSNGRSASQSVDESTRPIIGATYPLSLVPREADPSAGGNRFMGAVMVVMALAAYAVFVPLVNMGVVGLGYATSSTGLTWPGYFASSSSFGTVWGVAGAHLSIASMILAVWLLFHFVHRRRLEWAWSISPGIRWRYAVICLGVAIVVVGAVTAFHWMNSDGWNPGAGWGWFLLVIVLTTPLQAVAEELLFRGYLMQAFGSIVRNEWFAIVATALVFAVFHGTQNMWLFGSRFVFGLVAGILVWRTGGLEAGIAIHIINNICAFGLALFTGSLVKVRTTTEVGWADAAGDVGMFLVCAVLCWLVAWRMRVPTKVKD